MVKKLMVSALAACLLLGNLQAKSLRDVLGDELDKVHEGITKLDLGMQGIEFITDEEAHLLATNYPDLQELHLPGNKLVSLPAAIGKLTSLRVLNIARNRLVSLPASIVKLTNLATLYLNDNQLNFVPTAIGKLGNLQVLWIDNNKLSAREIALIRAMLPKTTKIYGAESQRTTTNGPKVKRRRRRLAPFVGNQPYL